MGGLRERRFSQPPVCKRAAVPIPCRVCFPIRSAYSPTIVDAKTRLDCTATRDRSSRLLWRLRAVFVSHEATGTAAGLAVPSKPHQIALDFVFVSFFFLLFSLHSLPWSGSEKGGLLANAIRAFESTFSASLTWEWEWEGFIQFFRFAAWNWQPLLCSGRHHFILRY